MRAKDIQLSTSIEDATAYGIRSSSRYDTWLAQKGYVLKLEAGRAFVLVRGRTWSSDQSAVVASDEIALTYTYADHHERAQLINQGFGRYSTEAQKATLAAQKLRLKPLPNGWSIQYTTMSRVALLWSEYVTDKLAHEREERETKLLWSEYVTDKLAHDREERETELLKFETKTVMAAARVRVKDILTEYGRGDQIRDYSDSVRFTFSEFEKFIEAVKKGN